MTILATFVRSLLQEYQMSFRHEEKVYCMSDCRFGQAAEVKSKLKDSQD